MSRQTIGPKDYPHLRRMGWTTADIQLMLGAQYTDDEIREITKRRGDISLNFIRPAQPACDPYNRTGRLVAKQLADQVGRSVLAQRTRKQTDKASLGNTIGRGNQGSWLRRLLRRPF